MWCIWMNYIHVDGFWSLNLFSSDKCLSIQYDVGCRLLQNLGDHIYIISVIFTVLLFLKRSLQNFTKNLNDCFHVSTSFVINVAVPVSTLPDGYVFIYYYHVDVTHVNMLTLHILTCYVTHLFILHFPRRLKQYSVVPSTIQCKKPLCM